MSVTSLARNQLLGLSRIPDLGATGDSGENVAVTTTTTTTTPAVVPSGGKGDEEQEAEEWESAPSSRWGEIEVRPHTPS